MRVLLLLAGFAFAEDPPPFWSTLGAGLRYRRGDPGAAAPAQARPGGGAEPGGALQAGMGWSYQLQGAVIPRREAKVYVVDLFSGGAVPQGAVKICYFSLTLEMKSRHDCASSKSRALALDERGDMKGVPAEAVGSNLAHGVHNGERECALDVGHPEVKRVMLARLALAKTNGCLGVELDNLDMYGEGTRHGLKASNETMLTFMDEAIKSAGGLLVGQKNAPQMVSSLMRKGTKFAIVESCAEDGERECMKYSPYTSAGMPVFQVEYKPEINTSWCASAAKAKRSLIFSNKDLDGKVYQACPNP